MSNSKATDFDSAALDALLDGTLDDLADLPSFEPFASGTHKVSASFSVDKINESLVIKLDFTYIECLELADPEATPNNPGDTCGVVFFMDKEFGQGNFKRLSAPFAAHFGIANKRDIVELKDIEVVIVTSLRAEKASKVAKGAEPRVYLEVKELAVL